MTRDAPREEEGQLSHRPAKGIRAQGSQGRLGLRRLPRAHTRGFTKIDKNQYGFGMRGQGTWAVLYATEFMYANGAQVLKDGKVAINSKEGAEALDWYFGLFRRHKGARRPFPPMAGAASWRASAAASPTPTFTTPAPWRSRKGS
jgi:ABC-type glycerol-3-phosphate transport system substrate-binding protein